MLSKNPPADWQGDLFVSKMDQNGHKVNVRNISIYQHKGNLLRYKTLCPIYDDITG